MQWCIKLGMYRPWMCCNHRCSWYSRNSPCNLQFRLGIQILHNFLVVQMEWEQLLWFLQHKTKECHPIFIACQEHLAKDRKNSSLLNFYAAVRGKKWSSKALVEKELLRWVETWVVCCCPPFFTQTRWRQTVPEFSHACPCINVGSEWEFISRSGDAAFTCQTECCLLPVVQKK